jgi:alpha-acetolactate decarboxylase
MHEVLGGGAAKARPVVGLADVVKRPHAYGVGALAGLEGEITIVDGEALVCRPAGAGLHVDGPSATPGDHAAMLTVAHVEQWRETSIPRSLASQELEDFIADAGRRERIDVGKPFPFVIDAKLSDLQAHVINGMCPMKPGAQLSAETQPWRYQLEEPIDATIVGFYAPDSVGKLTHPGTKIHAHVIFESEGRQVTAHVERLAVAGGSVLRLPAVR